MEWQTGLNGKTTKIKQWLNNTLHEDSTLTALLTAVYGENVPLEDLNLEELKGRQAELQITPNAKGFARIKKISAVAQAKRTNNNLDITDDDLPAGM